MSKKDIGSILKVNIPEFIQGMKHLDEYLEVSGEVFDDISDEIDTLRDLKHYRKTYDGMVDINLSELGFDVPVNLKMSIKRQILRDLSEIHLRGGTEDGIKQLLRLVGIEAEMTKGWLLNPKMMREGWHRDYFTREETRYSSNDRIYMDLLYGEVVDEEDGTFFEGYSYWDINKETKTDRIPIVGEVYDTVGTLGEDNVEATPYLIIRFEDDEIFLVDDEESVDPETGKVFPYTVNERFTLLEQIIQFFLVGAYRPTTMRIIVEAKLLDLEDSMAVAEKFTLKTSDVNREPHIDGVGISEIVNIKSTTTVDEINIGDSRIYIGQPSPLIDRWWGVNLKVGNNTEVPVIETWDNLLTHIHMDELTKEVEVPLLGECSLVKNGTDIDVIGIDEGGNEIELQDGAIPDNIVKLSLTTDYNEQQFITIHRKVRNVY